MILLAVEDATMITLATLVCTCIATMVGSTVTSVLAYLKSRDNATALIGVSAKGDANGKAIQVVHEMSNDRLTKCYEEIKDLREQLNLNLGTQAGTAAAKVQSDLQAIVAPGKEPIKVAIVSVPGVASPDAADAPDPINAGRTDQPYDLRKEIYP